MSVVDDYLEPFRLYIGGYIQVTNDVQTIKGQLVEVLQHQGALYELVIKVTPTMPLGVDPANYPEPYEVVFMASAIRSYRCAKP